MLSSAQNESTDLLWVLSGDSFPFQNMLMEGQTVLSVDGRVWALEEIPYKGQLSKLYSDSFGSQNPVVGMSSGMELRTVNNKLTAAHKAEKEVWRKQQQQGE